MTTGQASEGKDTISPSDGYRTFSHSTTDRIGREGYVLVFDFSKYFDTAQHGPVFREIERSGLDDRLVSLSEYL